MPLALTEASDQALIRIVALLDQAGAGGTEAALLDHARPRLRALRPPRPLRLQRLLYMPFEIAIHDHADWPAHREGLPRSALLSLAYQVRAGDPAVWADIEARAQGVFVHDHAQVADCGEALWRLASQVMPDEPPPDWVAATGLPAAEHAPLAGLCIAVWRHSGEIWAACPMAGNPDAKRLRAALAASSREAMPAFALCLDLAMTRSGAPALVAGYAARLGGPAGRMAKERLKRMLEDPPPPLASLPPTVAATEAWRQLALVTDLETGPLGERGDHRRQLLARRSAAARLCEEAFTAGVQGSALAALDRHVAGSGTGLDVSALEASARALQHLAAAGRKLGDPKRYDAAEKALAAELITRAATHHDADLTPMDYARLVEILCGSLAAARVVLPP